MADISIKISDFSKNLYKPILNCVNEVFGQIVNDIQTAFENEFSEEQWSIKIDQSKSYKNFVNVCVKYSNINDEESDNAIVITKTYNVVIKLDNNEITFSSDSLEFGCQNTYYEFLGHVMNISINNELFTSVNDNLNLIYTLAESYNVKAIANPNTFGSTEISSLPDKIYESENGEKLYEENSEMTLTATPLEHYKFVYWTQNGNIISNNPQYTFVLKTNGTFVANFEKEKYVVNVVVNNNEAYKYLSVGGIYVYNDMITVVAEPLDGYEFVNWTIGETEVSTSNSYQFQVTSDITIKANFIDSSDYDDEEDETNSSSF